ncbi:MAG: efflux RND transporter permease subunit [Planctomycetaceae bacterium]
MLSRFYKNSSRTILWLLALSFPFIHWQAQSIRSNNDIETWLPVESPVRAAYEQFKRDFGVEDLVMIGLETQRVSERQIEALCGRLDRLPGVRQCWSPGRLRGTMTEMGVPEEQIAQRLRGLAESDDGHLAGVAVLLSAAGLKDRAGTVRDVEAELKYAGLYGPHTALSGGPVVITEMDRLGGKKENTKFFLITLVICLLLLRYWVNDWKLAFSVLALTIWTIDFTLAVFKWCGGEMNFILGALSVMVMVFTLEASIHVIHYFRESQHSADTLGSALTLCWRPCLISLMTTAVGLFSVSVTDIVPVTQFGYAAALGAVIAMAGGLTITPAILAVLPQKPGEDHAEEGLVFARLAHWLLPRHRQVTVAFLLAGAVGLVGLNWLETKIEPLDFLPQNSQVVTDVNRIREHLTSLDSIEGVVEFSDPAQPFTERLEVVRRLERKLSGHSAVRHVMSAAMFFPDPLPDNPMKLLPILQKAQAQSSTSDFVVDGQRSWRISARIECPAGQNLSQVYDELNALVAGEPLRLTGLAPLIEQAQHEMLNGFWKSFTSAFLVIGLVMTIALRSVRITLLAMLPNVLPMGIIFGLLGWIRFPVDIGMMMTGSIALGISIDGTFHLLVRYRDQLRTGMSNLESVRVALVATGGPIFESIVVSSIGMLALAMSSFAPTYRFGLLMAVLLLATLVGDLLLLPALLCFGGDSSRTKTDVPPPVFLEKNRKVPVSVATRDKVA